MKTQHWALPEGGQKVVRVEPCPLPASPPPSNNHRHPHNPTRSPFLQDAQSTALPAPLSSLPSPDLASSPHPALYAASHLSSAGQTPA